MTKQHFIALADTIRFSGERYSEAQIEELASFCKAQNVRFDRERWLDYIAGACGKNGGRIKAKAGKVGTATIPGVKL